jgi:Tol biopolymer transport system component
LADVHSLKNTVHHIGSGIENFSWLPDGKGFLTSMKSSEKLHSDIVISKILLNHLNNKPRQSHLNTITVGKDEYYNTTSQFKYSPDGHWIAFLLVPTASLSADSNTFVSFPKMEKLLKRLMKC